MSELGQLCEEMRSCTACGLSRSRTLVVPGEGAEDADVLFIGEAPGWYEDQQARPFVGPAGKLLDELLALIGWRREQVYITNLVKCRPPGNRDPLPLEVQTCERWLEPQVRLIAPKAIVTLGRHSMERYYGKETIGRVHGKEVFRDGVVYYPLYHPAAVLRQPQLRPVMEADVRRLPELVGKAQKLASGTQPEQLSLF